MNKPVSVVPAFRERLREASLAIGAPEPDPGVWCPRFSVSRGPDTLKGTSGNRVKSSG